MCVIILLMIFTISCVPTKQLSYFNDLDELMSRCKSQDTETDHAFDKLYIKVISIDPQTADIQCHGRDEKRCQQWYYRLPD